MTRQFSIPTVLRMVPNTLLRQFFAGLGHGQFDPCWPKLKEREIEPILDYLGELPLDQLNELEGAMRSVSDLASDSGFDSLLEAAPLCDVSDLGSLVPADLSVWGRTMWVWLHHRAVFEKAQTIHQAGHMAWWRKRSDLPSIAPDKSPEAIAALEREVSSLLKSQGRGKDCTVEVLACGGVDYFFAHPDDYVRNIVIHDSDGRLSPEAFRQTILIVFAYHRDEGSLETCARLSKPMKERLESVFARTILHWDLEAYDPDAAYELDQLKDPSFDLTPDPADRLRVRIRRIRLTGRRCGRRLLIEVDDDPVEDIHRAMEECLNLESAPLSEWHATQATFCFEFLPMEGRKTGRQSFDVGWPRSCSLRNARPERVELIQKYLRRWKIDRASSPAPRLVAVGG